MGRLLVVRPDARLDAELASGLNRQAHDIEFCDGELEVLEKLSAQPSDLIITAAATSIGDDLALLERARPLAPRARMISLASTISHVELVAAMASHSDVAP